MTRDERPRRGQIASERARYQLGRERKVLAEGLGEPPPGYGLTLVAAWIRDPRHLVACWDVNDEEALAEAAREGWERLELRVFAEDGRELARATPGRRAGTWHLELPESGVTVRVHLGFHRRDGFYHAIARSRPVRMPPEYAAAGGRAGFVRVPPGFPRQFLAAVDGPPLPGHHPGGQGRLSAARRLAERLRLAVRLVPPEQARAWVGGFGVSGADGAAGSPFGPWSSPWGGEDDLLAVEDGEAMPAGTGAGLPDASGRSIRPAGLSSRELPPPPGASEALPRAGASGEQGRGGASEGRLAPGGSEGRLGPGAGSGEGR